MTGSSSGGHLKATKTTIDIGELTTLTVLNTSKLYANTRLEFSGPIDTDQYCPSFSPRVPGGGEPIVAGLTRVYYGCLPGGSATVRLVSGNSVLDSLTIDVAEPPAYDAIFDPPLPAIDCLFAFNRRKIDDTSTTIRSPGGYAHTSTVEIWESEPYEYDDNAEDDVIFVTGRVRCIEARIFNDSNPGASQSDWSGTLYKTRPDFMAPVVDLDALLQGNFSDFLNLFNDPDPITEGTIEREAAHTCSNCRGGGIQTVKLLLNGAIFRHYSVHLLSEHIFAVGNWRGAVSLDASSTVTPRTDLDFTSYSWQLTIELGELFLDFAIEQLRRLATWILMHI